ncbi:MAG: sortase [Coriobacteriaceae bacterium]|nr:sortase [Coriobacteriaceae bacterium]
MRKDGQPGTHKGEGKHFGARRRRELPIPQLLIGIGLVLCMVPVLSNVYWQQVAKSNVTTLTDTASALDPAECDYLMAQARAYNARLGGYEDPEAAAALAGGEILPYDQQLALDGNEAIGWVEVPKADISMTVYHGVGEPALSSGVGHQPETSLPVGGERCNSFLTGHSGMRQFRVFDGIRALEPGDVFAVHVLDEVFAYRVTGWEIVDPTNVDVRPEPGDRCTLVTCTTTPDQWNPKGRIGVNDKRLLVVGERCEYDPAEFEDAQADISAYVNDNTRPALIGACLLLAFAAMLLIGRYLRKASRRGRASAMENGEAR